MKENIFLQIMNLIEKETDMPLLEKALKEWLEEKTENEAIYEIYRLTSKNR